MSNGDSGADQEQDVVFEEQRLDWQELIETAPTVEFGMAPDGANFTVNVRQISQIELPGEQRAIWLAAIKSEITQLIVKKLIELPNPVPNPGEHVDVFEGLFVKYARY